MKTLDELVALLKSFGLPFSNGAFQPDERPAPPYIEIEAGYGESAYADNVAYLRWMPYDCGLYCAERDYKLEQRVETALDDAGFAYTKTITPIDGEGVIETAYQINVFE
ncbi:hypothetical protein AAAX31_00195 [Collinsella sp. CLA-ER-H5]|uniref:hypothetical protein n=1 Tax=Collinsella sp. CLA-ER-H5 TaxID=3136222 RepID=UPI0032C18D7D